MHFSFTVRKKRTTQGRPAGLTRLRLVAAATLLSALGLMVAQGAVAASAAPAGGTVGDPQPELTPFKVAGSGGQASGLVLPDGNLVVAFLGNNGKSVTVCVLHPGARTCASTAKLSPESGDSFSPTPQVLSTGGNEVSVAVYDCCNSGDDNAFVYNSSDGGKTFSKYVKAGAMISSIGAGTEANGQLVVADNESGGFQVQAFPPKPASPVATLATPNKQIVGDSSLTTYHGGVLVASDNLDNTYVEYAKSGSNYNASSSYKKVGEFGNEYTTTVSGDALLTDPGGSLTGGERLRFFNGSSFGSASKVPDAKPADDGYFTMQEVGGTVHVFFIARDEGYDLYGETTKNGSHWSALQQYASAIVSAQLVSVLGPTGAGIVLEADGSPLLAQPILNPQFVSIKLKQSKVRPGRSTTLTGAVRPELKGQLVTLERKSGKDWFNVTTTHESASGTFSFTVPGKAETYRAVVAYQPGYYLYGYSNSVSLAVS
jgi:hypothetical protein